MFAKLPFPYILYYIYLKLNITSLPIQLPDHGPESLESLVKLLLPLGRLLLLWICLILLKQHEFLHLSVSRQCFGAIRVKSEGKLLKVGVLSRLSFDLSGFNFGIEIFLGRFELLIRVLWR